MKKKIEEDLQMFEDSKQILAVLIPHTINSYQNIVKKLNTNKPKFVQLITKDMLLKLAHD